MVLFEAVPSVPPPVEYYKLLREWNAVGTNLNQLVKLAHIQAMKDLPFGKVIEELHDLIKQSNEQMRGKVS